MNSLGGGIDSMQAWELFFNSEEKILFLSVLLEEDCGLL